MSTKETFTNDELQTLQKGVTGAGLLVSVSDRGFFDSFKEATSLARELVEARRDNESEVVRQIAEMGGTGFAMTSSPTEVETETLEALRSSIATLQSKAPQEVDAYRRFVIEVAESVAGAAGGGETAESGALEKIRAALGDGGAAAA